MKQNVANIFKRPGVFVGIAIIRFYQKIISPALHAVFGGNGFCRFTPTCSEYARQALMKHGFFTGTLLAAWRVLRCNPLSRGGPDCVPGKGEAFFRLFRRQRIGIFGGSFDPVHNAHLELARAAKKTLRLDRLIFVPAAQSPLKNNAPGAPAKLRLEMLRSALRGETGTEISTWEIEQGGKSWSILTVEHFEDTLPRADFFWIFGADQLARLDQWHAAEKLCRKVTFGVMCRDADSLPDVPAPLQKLARVAPLPLPRIDLSSTEIREKITAGKFDELRDCLPQSVLTIIQNHHLYSRHADHKENHRNEKNEHAEARRRQIEDDKNYREPCWHDR